jgi:hypothetical protein
MAGSQQFYSFAAVVIPVLLFGGAVSSRWEPNAVLGYADKERQLAVRVWLTMMFAIFAETMAINAAFTAKPDWWERIIVVVAVVGGTVAAAGAIAWPWLELEPVKRYKDRMAGAGVLLGMVLTVVLLIATSGAVSDPRSTKLETLLSNIEKDQSRSASWLSEITKLDSSSQITLQRALALGTAEMIRTRAVGIALLRDAEQR